jgi:hypothetical protein
VFSTLLYERGTRMASQWNVDERAGTAYGWSDGAWAALGAGRAPPVAEACF